MNKKVLISILLGGGILIVLLLLMNPQKPPEDTSPKTIYQEPQEVIDDNVVADNPDALTPHYATMSMKRTTGGVNVFLSTLGGAVNNIEIKLSYDARYIKHMEIVPGKLPVDMTILFKNVDEEKGKITFIASFPKAEYSGEGVVLLLRFPETDEMLRGSGITFLPGTAATSLEYTDSVLSGMNNFTF